MTTPNKQHRLFCAADDAQREAWRNPNPETEEAATVASKAYLDFLAKQPGHGPIHSRDQRQRGRS